ncbi:TOBE domain-containing protein [Flammeovirgaceae bacterium SG7u.111]|nr:TOBE domain-containing protein [Flammeovirgaceae bacterium SG7u.132]WPO36184.1 TOBE domain-containing protein [Flammeovirgaceae bacterium SG7u.111]
MNTLKGNISAVKTIGSLSLVSVMVGKTRLSAIVIDTPENSPYLQEGSSINVIFKETEVILGKGNSLTISLQNKINGTVESIENGELLSRLTLQTEVGKLISIITSRAVGQLELAIGSEVVAMVKTNEIMLAE